MKSSDVFEIIMMVVVWAIFLVIFTFSKESHAESDSRAESDWFCTERAVVREGSLYKACGMSSSPVESDARMGALRDAKREFVSVCDSSDDCLGHEVTVTPGRTECIKGLLGYTCRRLLLFHVLETKSSFQYHPNYYMYMRGR